MVSRRTIPEVRCCPLPLLAAVALLLACMTATPARASQIFDGSVAIGSLTATVDSFGNENSIFVLLPQYRSMMSDVNGTQFRWFQVIYYDDEPTNWNGSVITPAGAPAHTGTVVDTPAGGWDYELPAGEDNLPFYETDGEINTSTGMPWAFPTLSYQDEHAADGLNPGYTAIQDSPSLADPNHLTLFETFLAYSDPSLRASQTFDVLGGYSWGIGTNASNVQSGIAPTDIPFSSINAGMLSELQGALNRSGYAGANQWTVQAVSNFAALPTPEPGTITMAAVCLAGILVRLRRHAS